MVRAQDPPARRPSRAAIYAANKDRNEFTGINFSPSCHPLASQQPPYNRTLPQPAHQHQNQPGLIRAHDCNGRDVRPSLRKRGSSLRPAPRSSSSYQHHNQNNKVDNNHSVDIVSAEEKEVALLLRRREFHPSSLSTAATTTTTTTATIKNLYSLVRLSRITAILFTCMLTFWATFWGVELSIDIARFTTHLMFGDGTRRRQFYSSIPSATVTTTNSKPMYHLDNIYEDSHTSSSSDVAASAAVGGLRGSMMNERSSTIHDLNAKSHLLKAEGRQILLHDGEQLIPTTTDNMEEKSEKQNIVQGRRRHTTSNMMNLDATHDFFVVGKVMETKRIVNDSGRIETISYPTHSYATLPISLEATSFAMSIWIFLSPSSSSSSLSMKNDPDEGVEIDPEGGAEIDERSRRRPRVILSTSSEGSSEGCYSDILGTRPTTGFVLYAEPNVDDDDDDVEGEENVVTNYRIILEYAQVGAHSCHTVIGSSQQNNVRIEEGSWSHIALFATETPNEEEVEEVKERVSVYVNGFLAGRMEESSRPHSESQSKSKIIIGRYAAQDTESDLGIDNEHFDLDGRVGMLSFWETGSHALLPEYKRMNIQSPSDEDHVVRSIRRAAFDIRSIKELALQGLTVKEPSLLYSFDGQKDRGATIDLYSEPDRSIYEHMSGKRNGTITSEVVGDNPAYQRKNFVPLGGNRYAEYKDGSYVPPKLTASEHQELNEIARARSVLVKKAMQHVWRGYETYAYGKDELLPISKGGQDNWGGMGTTLVDSLSTLWIMGLKDEFWKARDWVRDVLDFNQVKSGVSVFETTIRNLAGLLSAYDLSGDKVFLDKSDDLGLKLMRAFSSKTGIPYGEVELFDGGRSYNTGWHSNEAVLSEIGTLQVEFRYLAKVTGKSEYATEAMRALDEVLKLDSESGLFPTFIYNTEQVPSFGNDEISLGAMGDSFYEYLLKVWLQGGRRETKYRHMYDKSVQGIMDKLLHMSRPNHLTYVAELKEGRVVHKMDHLACFLGGTLALGAYSHPDGLESTAAQRQLKTGKQLAYTCYQMYARSKSGLSPEFVRFDNANDDFAHGNAPFYILRPETVETLYILYHLTKDPVYREWGWEIFQAIEEHCKTDAGYAAIQNVDTMNQNNRMESFFLAETLKYLYLLQDDSNDIDLLHTHVFNTEAHPLRLLSLAPEN